MCRTMRRILKDEIQVVVFDFRGVRRHLRSWLDTMPHVKRASDICPEDKGAMYLLAMRRNIVAKWFLEKSSLPWLLMINDNVIPLESVDELLACEADVAGAHFFSRRGGEGHDVDGSVATACVKISRRAFERIPPPYFRYEYNDDHTERLQCECGWFCKQAIAAGFYPVKAGVVAHMIEVALIPPTESGGQCKMKFLQDIPLATDEVNNG